MYINERNIHLIRFCEIEFHKNTWNKKEINCGSAFTIEAMAKERSGEDDN
jgi:hypothetical protein